MNPKVKALILSTILISILPTVAMADIPRLIAVLKGTNELDQLGWNSDGIGDINGDGLGDFIVCQERNPEKMMIYLGGPHPFDVSPVLTIFDYNYPRYAGDLDCDGTPDFFAVSPNGDTMRLYLGMENLDEQDYLEFHADTIADENYEYFRIVSLGDNNNDGYPDFWLYDAGERADTMWGYSGGNLLDTTSDFSIHVSHDPDNKYHSYSRTACNNCDLNGDSVPDVIFGQVTGSDVYPGRILITWGGENMSPEPDLIFYAPGMGAIDDPMFGSDLACMGDISGDGIDDLWVRQGGRSYVYHGGQYFDTIPDLALDYTWTEKVENIGDINDDGWNDIMLIYTQIEYSQIAFMYCGPTMDTIIDMVYRERDIEETVEDSMTGAVYKVGISYSWVGDVDGDNINDILVNGIDGVARGWMFIFGGWDDPIVDVNDIPDQLPSILELHQNYPNPFNSGTVIEFALPRSGYTEFKIYNILGELIATPVQGYLTAGEHQVIWDGRDNSGNITATGIYFYQITTGDVTQTKKMILLK